MFIFDKCQVLLLKCLHSKVLQYIQNKLMLKSIDFMLDIT